MQDDASNRAIYERFCHEVLMRGDLDAVDQIVDANVVSHSPFPGQAPGRQGFKAGLSLFRAAFPDMTLTIRDIVSSGDKVVGYFSVRGVHRGELFGVPATGKEVSYDEIVIVRFAGGKIVEHWSVADTLAMMQALGAVVPADQAARGPESGAAKP